MKRYTIKGPFCSELVADILTKLELLSGVPSTFAPVDFERQPELFERQNDAILTVQAGQLRSLGLGKEDWFRIAHILTPEAPKEIHARIVRSFSIVKNIQHYYGVPEIDPEVKRIEMISDLVQEITLWSGLSDRFWNSLSIAETYYTDCPARKERPDPNDPFFRFKETQSSTRCFNSLHCGSGIPKFHSIHALKEQRRKLEELHVKNLEKRTRQMGDSLDQ